MGGSLLVATCERESGADMNVTSKIQISGHRLKPVPREPACAPFGAELLVADGTTQEV